MPRKSIKFVQIGTEYKKKAYWRRSDKSMKNNKKTTYAIISFTLGNLNFSDHIYGLKYFRPQLWSEILSSIEIHTSILVSFSLPISDFCHRPVNLQSTLQTHIHKIVYIYDITVRFSRRKNLKFMSLSNVLVSFQSEFHGS